MLLQTTVPPQLLSGMPADPLSQKLFCNLWLGLLYDCVESCVLVLPGNHVAESDYLTALAAWPPKYQKRGQELLTMLRQRRRFVPSELAYVPAATCADPACQAFIGVATVNTEAFHFIDEKCALCPNFPPLSPRSVEALEYFVSQLSRLRRERLAYVLGDGQWKQSDFERQVLRPVLATAKHVKIYDRWIGRSALDLRYGRVRFSPRYRQTLDWVVGVFLGAGGAGRGGVFEIYCGIESHLINARQRAQLKAEMQNFQTAIRAATGIPVQLLLKEETYAARCPHGRYLVTDQAGVLIDRGFDLLWDDHKMQAAGMNPTTDPRPIRDVAVMLCNDCNSVETQTRMLPPL